MQSIRELYRIGLGPSSSHTMAPRNAAEMFKRKYPHAVRYRVTLYGSLAATGKGHLTDMALLAAFEPKAVEIIWKPEISLPTHPNGMLFEALGENDHEMSSWTVFSVGGGALREEGEKLVVEHVYDLTTMTDIVTYCEKNGLTLWEYVVSREGEEIWQYMEEVLDVMMDAIERGLNTEGVLPGDLLLQRKACSYHRKIQMTGPHFKRTGYLMAYALAVSEENAAGGTVVTAPTCGSSGVLPSVLKYMGEVVSCHRDFLIRALLTAGLIGTLVKANGSISGAEVGCQGEVGTACSMASGAAVQLMGGSPRQIEFAAESGLEHYLGLTCDPIGGYVQIPCIERNAFAAPKAVACANYALFSDGSHAIPFDEVVSVMLKTGHDLPCLYRETSGGGLATAYSGRACKK